MGVLSTEVVLRCYRCGKPVRVARLATAKADPDGSILNDMLKNLRKNALCDFHQRQRDYYANQGRSEEWLRGSL